MGMMLMKDDGLQAPERQVSEPASRRVSIWIGVCLLTIGMTAMAWAQGVTTTTVQGTVYLANGQPGSGTLAISWPSFTTASGQTVTADSLTVTIPADGFVSVNLAPNVGATPAGEYYTAVFYMSDGTVTTQYWVVPAAASATIAQVQAQIMPAAQAVQTVSKGYVDQAITELTGSLLTASGGALSGPLTLNGNPTQPLQAATKQYVDTQVATALPLAGGTVTGSFSAKQIGGALQVDQFAGGDFGAKVQACVNALNASYGGTCDARNFSGSLAMGSNLTISASNATIWLPCATITTANQIVVTAGTRNVSLRGCALRGGSQASGSQGGTVFAYSGTGAMVKVGDPTYAVDTPGFHMENVAINITAATSTAAQGFVAYRTQELDLESLYFLGNSNQTGMTLDGTGNYSGGTFTDIQLSGFLIAVNAIGHQIANAATTDWLNASTFLRLHINCPESGGYPIAGTFGVNLLQGDGNTITGGDVEGCATAVHLGVNAQDNTIVGLRNENSTNQMVADTGSRYNSWITGGAMYTGEMIDNGTRNSFLDTFHRSFNGLNGDWYGSQQDATLTNHTRLGIGNGNERGLLNEVQTDYGYRWEEGYSDGTTGVQSWFLQDLLNNVPRISVAQYLSSVANVVTNVVLNNAGCYTSSNPPTISFSGGGGSGASATATMYAITSGTSCVGGYGVASVTMTNPGSGYTSQPAVSWSGINQTTSPNAIAEIATAGSTNNATVLNAAGTGAVVLNGSNGAGTGGVVFGSGGATETTVGAVDKQGNATFNGNLLVGGSSQSTGTITVRNNADAEVDYFLWPGLTTSQKASYTYKDWNGNSQWYMVKNQFNDWALNSAVGGLDSFKAYQSTNSGDTYIDASNSTGHIRLNYESGSGAETDIYSGSSSSLIASFQNATNIKFPGLAATSGHSCLQVDNAGYISNTGSVCGSGGGDDGYAGVTSAGSGGLAGNPGTGQTWQITPTGFANLQASITATTPVCDIRAYGAQLGSQDIGPFVQDCVNHIYPWTPGNTQTVLLDCGNGGCYWDNPSALTFPHGGPFRFELQGYLTLGSPLVTNAWENWYGTGPPGAAQQFQTGTPALMNAPQIYGTLGTAVTTTNQGVVVTPSFACSGNSPNGNCNIAHMPAGSAITIAGTTTTTGVSATAVSQGYYRLVTLTLPSQVRYLALETLTVSGCSDASLNITNGVISKIDYSTPGGEQVSYQQSATGATTATGCSITSFDEDKYESVRLFCSNGTSISTQVSGLPACGSGQFTIVPIHAHSASDVWGAVAVSPSWNEQGGHTFHDININQSYGMSYWGEQESNLDMYNVGMGPTAYAAAGGMEQTASWVGSIGQLNYSPVVNSPGSCWNGGCLQPSYPFGLRCDSESQILGAGGGSGTNTGCGAMKFSGGSFIGGGIKIDGQNTNAITTLPEEISNFLFEQVPAAIVIDNRHGIYSSGCLNIFDNSLQDNVTQSSVYYVAYTNNESPSNACYKLSDLSEALTSTYTNPYFNDAATFDRIPVGTTVPTHVQPAITAAGPTILDGREIHGAVRGSGAGFGPQILPFGSLPINNNPSSWASSAFPYGCGSGNTCAVATNKVSCPDGPQATSSMQCAELDGPGSPIWIGTWTGSTYAGDQFIYGCYVRPGANLSFPVSLQNQDVFMLSTQGTDTFTPNAYGGTNYTTPSAGFGTGLSYDSWYPLIAVAAIATGEATSHSINFELSPGSGPGNQFSNCRWAFIPGPNNPAYAGVTQDEVAFARDNQYRGAVPANTSAGTAATGEPVSAGAFQVNGVALNAPSEIYNASASGAITLPPADRAEATYVLSGNVTASIGPGAGGAKVTIFVCQPASGGPYSWTWPSNWKGGVTVGATAGTCSEQTGTYIGGFSDWHGDAGTVNVPQ